MAADPKPPDLRSEMVEIHVRSLRAAEFAVTPYAI
jgi:hypothetical protein